MIDPARSVEALERRIDELRAGVRRAVTAGDRATARALRAELRRAEHAWEDALATLERVTSGVDTDAPAATHLRTAAADPAGEPPPAGPRIPRQGGPLLPVRERVHQALTLLGAPAAARLVVAVHRAWHPGEIPANRLTSLRRDEERSFRAGPHSRPYYICAALTADLLAPARGLLAVSTWPLATRIVGPLSARVDFLTAAVRLAEHAERAPAPDARRLLWRFAASIPDAAASPDAMRPTAVAAAARAELALHADPDRAHREAAADRARRHLDDAERLFGSRLSTMEAAG